MSLVRDIKKHIMGVSELPYMKKNKLYKIANSEKWKIIDVRAKVEYEELRIATSINIPINKILKNIDSYVDKEKEKILIICAHGRKSALVVKELYANGYDVHVLKNGIMGLHKTKWSDLLYIE